MTHKEETYKIKQELTKLKPKTMTFFKLVLYGPLQPAATTMGCDVTSSLTGSYCLCKCLTTLRKDS